MDFDALLATLPNGLHDADLLSLTIDLASAEVHLVVDVDLSDPDDPASEGRARRARLTFTGVTAAVVDPPATEQAVLQPAWIDAGTGVPETSPLDGVRAPEDGFLAWIYLESTNAFVRVAARASSLDWLADPQAPR